VNSKRLLIMNGGCGNMSRAEQVPARGADRVASARKRLARRRQMRAELIERGYRVERCETCGDFECSCDSWDEVSRDGELI
jgi:hypothetical protein